MLVGIAHPIMCSPSPSARVTGQTNKGNENIDIIKLQRENTPVCDA